MKGKNTFKQTETRQKDGGQVGEIPEGWENVALSDMAKLIKNSYKPTDNDNFAYIGLEHINQQSMSLNSIGHSSEVESNKFIFQSGDILFGKLRPYFRKVYRPRFNGVCSTDIWVVRAKKGTDQGYLFYFMANQNFVDLASLGSSGTRMPRADWKYLKDTRWNKPPLCKQRAIAKILFDLDDKIELNCQMNKTLEAIGQALFKRWFVDFEFPDKNGKPYKSSGGRLVDSELGEIPDGWRINKLGNIADVNWGDTNTTKASYAICGYDAYSASGLDGKMDHYDYEQPGIILSAIGVNCGDTWFAIGKWSCIKNTIRILSFSDDVSIEYIYLYSYGKYFWPRRGSAQPFISQTDARNIPILLPSATIMDNFTRFTRGLLIKITGNQQQFYLLSQIRDSLLPRLISGKIKVHVQ